jgi:orotate phosphoribosyltransferase
MFKTSVSKYFIKQLVDYNILSTGDFELAGGLRSNFYYEFEKFNDGKALDSVGFAYLAAAKDYGLDYEVIYGSAYKGAFIAIAMASYAWHWDIYNSTFPIQYVVERKESKNRNDKGLLVGASIVDKKVLLVDDVATTFTTLKRSLDIINTFPIKSVSILVGVNRSGIDDPRLNGIGINSIVTHGEFLSALNQRV